MQIKAFQALRPPAALAEQVASVPYDVVNTEEARALAEGNPHSFLHVLKPEIDLDPGISPYDDAVYDKAASTFQAFQDEGYLIREAQPCLYAYRQIMDGHAQVGLVCCCHAGDYEADIIKKHEKTRPDKEDDRTRHVSVLSANAGPVFLTFPGQAEIVAMIHAASETEPLYDFTAAEVQHTVWKIDAPEALVEAFASVPAAYVADGHHRSASAARVARERAAKNPNHTGEEEYNWFLAVLFPADELQVLAYNRVVKDLNGLTKESLLEAASETFSVTPTTEKAPSSPGRFQMYLDGQWYALGWDAPETPDPVDDLDVSILQDRLLRPLLGIEDPRKSKRIEFIGGIHGPGRLEELVDAGKAAVGFSLHPTTVEQLISVADAQQMMPPKSTWFEPKLRSGLLVHTLENPA